MTVVDGCRYNCDPAAGPRACMADCVRRRGRRRSEIKTRGVPVPVVDLPLGATEDRVVGALDLERALTEGVKSFEPGLLARAHRGFLYIDEVNLLEDHLADLLLDVAASGENLVEREGLSVRHPARFVLVGSGNPEEGELTLIRAARALAALDGEKEVGADQLRRVAPASLRHRLRRAGWDVSAEPVITSKEVVEIVRSEWYAVIGLSLSCDDGLDELTSEIEDARKMSRNGDISVMVGGRVFVENPEFTKRVGADAMAVDGRHAVLQADSLHTLLAARC
jgi:Mg-chelatase subunit ChlI